jgi:hypothetical protein
MMIGWKHFLWLSLALLVFVFPGYSAWADEKSEFDHENALEQLHERA